MLDMEEKTIHKRIRKGIIKSIKKGGIRYISELELEKIMPPNELIIPERFPDCVSYSACIDKHAHDENDPIFGCVGCESYEKGQLIERSW